MLVCSSLFAFYCKQFSLSFINPQIFVPVTVSQVCCWQTSGVLQCFLGREHTALCMAWQNNCKTTWKYHPNGEVHSRKRKIWAALLPQDRDCLLLWRELWISMFQTRCKGGCRKLKFSRVWWCNRTMTLNIKVNLIQIYKCIKKTIKLQTVTVLFLVSGCCVVLSFWKKIPV